MHPILPFFYITVVSAQCHSMTPKPNITYQIAQNNTNSASSYKTPASNSATSKATKNSGANNSKAAANSKTTAKSKENITKTTVTKAGKAQIANPGIVKGNSVNNFLESGNMFTKGSINQFNNLDRGAKKTKTNAKSSEFSKLKKGFKHLTKDMSNTF